MKVTCLTCFKQVEDKTKRNMDGYNNDGTESVTGVEKCTACKKEDAVGPVEGGKQMPPPSSHEAYSKWKNNSP